jgi:hypothetical protein
LGFDARVAATSLPFAKSDLLSITHEQFRRAPRQNTSPSCVVLRSGEMFGVRGRRISPNHPALIRSILIDSGGQ